jgi:hypothetical protein
MGMQDRLDRQAKSILLIGTMSMMSQMRQNVDYWATRIVDRLLEVEEWPFIMVNGDENSPTVTRLVQWGPGLYGLVDSGRDAIVERVRRAIDDGSLGVRVLVDDPPMFLWGSDTVNATSYDGRFVSFGCGCSVHMSRITQTSLNVVSYADSSFCEHHGALGANLWETLYRACDAPYMKRYGDYMVVHRQAGQLVDSLVYRTSETVEHIKAVGGIPAYLMAAMYAVSLRNYYVLAVAPRLVRPATDPMWSHFEERWVLDIPAMGQRWLDRYSTDNQTHYPYVWAHNRSISPEMLAIQPGQSAQPWSLDEGNLELSSAPFTLAEASRIVELTKLGMNYIAQGVKS